VLRDSWVIASFADRIGAQPPLILKGWEKRVREYSDRADRCMAVGRALVVRRLLDSGAARAEVLPRQIPGAIPSSRESH
jgi:hypothetical protein